MLINSIYRATEGEGIHIGSPQVFLRLQGCTIGCLNCDSKDTWVFDNKTEHSLGEIKEAIKKESLDFRIKRLSITGGDPLHPRFEEELLEVISWAKGLGFWINIEAAGSRISDAIFDRIDFISFDVKTPSTGVETPYRNILKLVQQYPKNSQIKSVIESEKDFHYVLGLREKLLGEVMIEQSWVLTPSYNLAEEFPQKRFEEVIAYNENAGAPFRVIGQQHKWIFGPDKKQV